MRIDLQLHSTYSDGYLTPTELVKLAKKNDIKALSLTDHNTVGGTYEFKKACKKRDIKAITGMELYVKYNNHKLNILWYNFDETDPRLHDLLRNSQKRRRKQVRNVLKRMIHQGFKIEPNKILDRYNHYVPINRVVDDVLEKTSNQKLVEKKLKRKIFREGDVIKEFFQNPETPPILRNSFIDINRVFELREKIGGQIILCHPAKHSWINLNLWEKYKKLGVDGIEVLSPHHSYGAVMYLQYLAREYDFVETGGSDFHKKEGKNFPIQRAWDYFHIDSEYLRGVETIIGK